MHSNSIHRRGAISLGLAWLTTTLSLGGVVVQDWYVDVNHPACGTGIGTQASPFCDVMDAVSAAADGDTIHIAPGTYFENVVLDRDLHLIGTGGKAMTILDGAASGSVVHVLRASSSLTGLTLTNGAAFGGGGLYVYNTAGDCGGGEAHLLRCAVTGNTAEFGGGIYVGGAGGGGIFCGGPGVLTLVDSSVTGNSATGDNLGGGGIVCGFLSPVTIERSTVSGNTCSGASGTQGAGIWNVGGQVAIRDSIVTDNSAVGGAIAWGGGIMTYDAGFGESLTIVNSTVSGNSVAGTNAQAGAIFLYATGADAYDDLTLANAILWGNGSSPLVQSGSGAPSIYVSHCLVEGGWAGAGNFDADPLFVDPLTDDFRLMPGSPCIDAGSNLSVPLDVWADLAGKFRFIDDPLTPDTGHPGRLLPIVDMGAHEFGVDPPRKVRRR